MRARSFSVVSSASPSCSASMISAAASSAREAVMIGKRAPLRHGDAGLRRGGKKLLRIADAGKGQHLAPLQRRRGARIGHQPAMQTGKPARAGGGDDVAGAAALAHHQQRVGARELRVERRAQRPGGKHAPLPMPRRPSTTAMVKSLASEAFCKPSSMITTLAPAAAAACAPATRSRATMVGATRASSSASSPTSPRDRHGRPPVSGRQRCRHSRG